MSTTVVVHLVARVGVDHWLDLVPAEGDPTVEGALHVSKHSHHGGVVPLSGLGNLGRQVVDGE
jgi:hypothetical protein